MKGQRSTAGLPRNETPGRLFYSSGERKRTQPARATVQGIICHPGRYMSMEPVAAGGRITGGRRAGLRAILAGPPTTIRLEEQVHRARRALRALVEAEDFHPHGNIRPRRPVQVAEDGGIELGELRSEEAGRRIRTGPSAVSDPDSDPN